MTGVPALIGGFIPAMVVRYVEWDTRRIEKATARIATMSGRRVPAPPRDLMDAMGAAARAGDHVETAMLNARYRAWLRDVHGISETRRWEN